MKYLTAIIAILLGFLCGCATQQPKMMWFREGTPGSQFYQDRYACSSEVERLLGPTPSSGSSVTVNVPPPVYGNRPLTIGDVYRPPDPALVGLAADAMRRNNMISDCLNAKGYRLIPADSK